MPTVSGINWAAVAGLLAIGTVLGSVVMWIFRSGKKEAGQAQRIEQIATVLREIEGMRQDYRTLHAVVERLVARDEARSPYFDELQRSLAIAAHKPSPSHAKKDRLLEELQALTLTKEREDELKAILQAEIDDPEIPVALSLNIVSEAEKLRIGSEVNAARLLLATIPIVKASNLVKDKAAMHVIQDKLSEEPPGR